MRIVHLMVAPVLLAACIPDPGTLEPGNGIPPADYARFVTEVQPILDVRCSSPSCHGNSRRPLELYAVGQHRLALEDLYRDTPLTENELEANFIRACSFMMDAESPQRCQLVTKPLQESKGGVGHEGGVLFEDTSDRDYEVLLDWITLALEAQRSSS